MFHRASIAQTLFLIALCCGGVLNLPAQQTATDGRIHAAEVHLRMFPKDPGGYDQLGAEYLQKGRETGDASYYELAKKSLQKSLDMYGSDMRAATPATYMAVVMMAEHRFQDALAWGQRALGFGLGDPSPWAIVGDAYADLGEYGKAEDAYAKLVPPSDGFATGGTARRQLFYERDSRMSYLQFINGNTQAAIELMEGAIRAGLANRLPMENIAWSFFQLGDEFFHTGNLPQAERAYQDSLSVYPGYYRALAGLAKVRAAQGRLEEATELYERSLRVIPVAEYAANLGDVYTRLGRLENAKKQYDLVEFTGYLSTLNQSLNNRELAQYYADHGIKLKESLEFARKELEVRRDVYTWDVLAWALYQNGKVEEAADAITQALRLGTNDALFFFHAGMIFNRLGDAAKGNQYLERALATNPNFHIVYADAARSVIARNHSVTAGRLEARDEQQ